MRLLADVSLFERQAAPVTFLRKRSVISSCGVKSTSEFLAVPESVLDNAVLSCGYLGRSVLREYFFQRLRHQDFLSLEYIYSGEILIRSGERAYVAEPGDLCLLHPNRDNALLHLPGAECRKAGMIPAGTLLPELLKSLRLDRVEVIRLEPALWDDAFDRMWTHLHDVMDPAARRRLSGEMFELLNLMADLSRAAPVAADMAEFRTYLEDHLAEPLDMKRLAAGLGMSLPTLNKRFRAGFNMTPYRYLIRARLLRAARLLCESRLTVKEIGALVGYGSPFHFSVEFTRFHGCSPREFRRLDGGRGDRQGARFITGS